MPNTLIIGSGCYIPENIIEGSHFKDSVFYDDNNQLIEKQTEEIIQKFVDITEIERRRYLSHEDFNSDLGLRASLEAIEDAGIDKEEIDYIIYATNFGEVDVDGILILCPHCQLD